MVKGRLGFVTSRFTDGPQRVLLPGVDALVQFCCVLPHG